MNLIDILEFGSCFFVSLPITYGIIKYSIESDGGKWINGEIYSGSDYKDIKWDDIEL